MQSLELFPVSWLLEPLKKKSQIKSDNVNPLVELDTPSAVKRATEYLRGPAPKAIAFEGGNDTTYKVAARVREFGISESECLDLMGEHWNEAGKAEPPWDAEDLQTIIGNAYRYATAGWGGMSGLADFAQALEPVEISEEPNEPHKIYWLQFTEAAEGALVQLNDPLVEDLLDQQTFSMAYGKTNTGKTFLLLDIAFHIATGRPWNGKATSQGLVVYVAAEGGRGILKRIAALKHHYKEEGNPALAVIPCAVNLLNSKKDMAALVAAIKGAEAVYGCPTKLVIIDTLSRALAGGDEHGPKDMGEFIKNIDKLRKETNAAFLVVHHTGKDEAKGARGWSGVTAAIDTELEVSKTRLRVTKQRDMEPIKDIRFKLESVTIGTDKKGRPVRTCAVKIFQESEFIDPLLSPEEEQVLSALQLCQRAQAKANDRVDEWENEPVSRKEWIAFAVSEVGVDERTIERRVTTLVAHGVVRKARKGREMQYVSLTSDRSDTSDT
jgi:AAA domain